MSKVIVRSFQESDRSAVREICCDTADRGGPIERTFPDRQWAADLLTSYYTDYEPSASVVAEIDGKVVGYVQASFDNRRYGLVIFWILGPRLIWKAFQRGLLFRAQLWRIVAVALRNWRRLFHWRKKSFHSHQGHMHIGIAKEARGLHIGRQLVEILIQHAKAKGVQELAASVHSSNTAACRFFEKSGFEVRDSYPMVMLRGETLEHYDALLYVKTIA